MKSLKEQRKDITTLEKICHWDDVADWGELIAWAERAREMLLDLEALFKDTSKDYFVWTNFNTLLAELEP